MGEIGSVPIPLPSLPEQRAIAAILCDMDVEIVAPKRRRDKTKAIMQGMMQALLTGTYTNSSPRTGIPVEVVEKNVNKSTSPYHSHDGRVVRHTTLSIFSCDLTCIRLSLKRTMLGCIEVELARTVMISDGHALTMASLK